MYNYSLLYIYTTYCSIYIITIYILDITYIITMYNCAYILIICIYINKYTYIDIIYTSVIIREYIYLYIYIYVVIRSIGNIIRNSNYYIHVLYRICNYIIGIKVSYIYDIHSSIVTNISNYD